MGGLQRRSGDSEERGGSRARAGFGAMTGVSMGKSGQEQQPRKGCVEGFLWAEAQGQSRPRGLRAEEILVGSASQMEGRDRCIAWLAGEMWADSLFAFSRN